MGRHKHEPKHIRFHNGGWTSVEECVVCGRRRAVHTPMGYRRKETYSRWVTKEEAEKYMLSWLWQ